LASSQFSRIATPTLNVSSDGRHLYFVDRKIAVFERNRLSGRLSLVSTTSEGLGFIVVGGATAVASSPDGAHLYVGATDSIVGYVDFPRSGGCLEAAV
jgi:hypothetical protein